LQKNLKSGALLARVGKLVLHSLVVLCLTLLLNGCVKVSQRADFCRQAVRFCLERARFSLR
jgi:hypothetical protein